jgi:hypothetical protein
MSGNDHMTDGAELRALRGSLSGVAMPERPRLEAITARGRARRRHRLSAVAGLSMAGAAAGAALVLGLTGAVGPAATPGTIRTAAFTLTSNANGTDTLTINPGELLDPTALQSAFAQYGIPAEVTTDSICTSDPAPAGFSQVVTSNPAGPYTATPQNGVQPTITIDPSAMPAGTELSVGDFQLTSGEYSGQQQADFVLTDTSSYTCSSTPPDPNGLPDGYGPADGIGVLYGGPAGS